MSFRAVFDCMIFVQAANNANGPAMACFDRLTERGARLCLSNAILLEIGEVLNRPELRRRLPLLTPERVGKFLDEVKQAATVIEQVPRVCVLPRDPKDEPYINLAIAADAEFLVTWNHRHLTYLMKEDTPEGREFRRAHRRIIITDPVSFLRQ